MDRKELKGLFEELGKEDKKEEEKQKDRPVKININGSNSIGNNNCNYTYNIGKGSENKYTNGPYMIECPNCSRPVSRRAFECPGCKHPVALHLQKIVLLRMVKANAIIAVAAFGLAAAGIKGISPFFSIVALISLMSLLGTGAAYDRISKKV
ncbi:MAG: hypothetical protein SCI25_15595 [Desulfuromonadales bacterium]|nr:hypothetical protein [Desulfuromonadales bacterium]